MCELFCVAAKMDLIKALIWSSWIHVCVNTTYYLAKLLRNSLVPKLRAWKKKRSSDGLYPQYAQCCHACFEGNINMAFFRFGNGHSVQLLESLWCGNCANLLAVSTNWSGSISAARRDGVQRTGLQHSTLTHIDQVKRFAFIYSAGPEKTTCE